MVLRLLSIVFLICVSLMSYGQEERTYYVGLDIGPKFDIYRLASGGTQPYSPNIKIHNHLAATFGILGGVKLDNKLLIEAGVYKSDYRVNIDIIDEQGRAFFVNTPINTFTSYMIPFHFNGIRTKQGKYEPMHFIYGTGFTVLAGTKRGIKETYFSPEVPVDPLDVNQGFVSYQVSNNSFSAKIVLVNINLGYQYPINDYVNINLAMNSKVGVAGSNYFDIQHNTPNHKVTNSIFTKGTSIQFNIGFRYFILPDDQTQS